MKEEFIVEIRLVNLGDVNDIVRFHEKQFPEYYLTQLGSSILYRYYEFFITSPKNKCFLILKKEQIAGIALFVENFEEQISEFYSKYKILLARSILKKLLMMNRVVWGGTFERFSVMLSNSDQQTDLPELTLLSLAISEKYRGQGLGRQLLAFAEEYYTLQEVDSYYLSVLSDNERAIKFYEQNGFIVYSSNERLYYMLKHLTRD